HLFFPKKVQLSKKRIHIGQKQLSVPRYLYIFHFSTKFILNCIKGFAVAEIMDLCETNIFEDDVIDEVINFGREE
ncbi:hypothetical protein S245_049335, partial [Arachis hypogaea]